MDPLTHGLAGAAAAASFSDKEKIRASSFAGAAAAMMADLDYFISIPSDPLFNIEIHRQFSHSLVFIPVGALIASLVLWVFLKKQLTAKQLYLFSVLGYSTAGLLDAFTSYGTQLLWPFLDTRFSWNLISVIDPVVTTGLIMFTGFSIWFKKKPMAWSAGGWLFLFLLYGWVQHGRAVKAAQSLASGRDHSVERMVVKPTIANQRLWRATYIYDGHIQTDAIRTGITDGITIYEGESKPRLLIEQEYINYEGTTLYDDLIRFKHLSDNYLLRHPDKPEIIGDARYSMLPTELTPLWGVEIDTTKPDRHLPFLYFRDASEETRVLFWNMLMGT
jgi:inner membrane protein